MVGELGSDRSPSSAAADLESSPDAVPGSSTAEPAEGADGPRRVRSRLTGRGPYVAASILILIAAAVVRLMPMGASLPYPAYVDEVHTLVHGAVMVDTGSLDPKWYDYPTLPIAVSAGVNLVVGLPSSDEEFRSDLDWMKVAPVVDDIRPTDRLLLGNRLVSVAFSLATVLVMMLAAARLTRRRTALIVGVFVAVAPALVSRAGFDLVDTMVTFFVAAAFYTALRSIDASRRRSALAWVALAGACAGLAAGSKYPGGAAIVMVLVMVVAGRPGSFAIRAARAAIACVAAALVFVASMPALVTNLDGVITGVTRNFDRYGTKDLTSRYWSDAPSATEVGIALLALGFVGIVLLLRRRRTRIPTIGWLAYSVLLVGVASRLSFQPFRNVLSVVPFACLAAAFGVDAVATALGRWRPALPRWSVDLVAAVGTAAIALSLVLGGVVPFLSTELALDTRREAREWLEANVSPGDSVTVMAELSLAQSELDRLPGSVTVVSAVDGSIVQSPDVPAAPDGEQFLVTGTLQGVRDPWNPDPELSQVEAWGRARVSPNTNFHRADPRVVVFRSG